MKIGESKPLLDIAQKLLETYTLEELLEISDLEQDFVVYQLLLCGYIDPDLVKVL